MNAGSELMLIVFTAVITGGISAVTTVAALRVHITYIREALTRHESAINRAHQRVDDLERNRPA